MSAIIHELSFFAFWGGLGVAIGYLIGTLHSLYLSYKSNEVTCHLWAMHKKGLKEYLDVFRNKPFDEEAQKQYQKFHDSICDEIARVGENHPAEAKKFCEESNAMWKKAIKAVLKGEDNG